MIKQLPIVSLALLLTILFSCKEEITGSPELTLFSDTINWNWEVDEFYGGNSFYWWHNTDHGVVNLGEMPADCWKTPYDFEHGHFYIRFEILEQPSMEAFHIQLGFWQEDQAGGGRSEAISSRFLLEEGSGTVLDADLGSPASWWQLNPDKPVDFCKIELLNRIGLALWKADPLCLPMGQGWSNSQACSNPEEAAREFFPMKARVSVVAVADGHSFSGWENYP